MVLSKKVVDYLQENGANLWKKEGKVHLYLNKRLQERLSGLKVTYRASTGSISQALLDGEKISNQQGYKINSIISHVYYDMNKNGLTGFGYDENDVIRTKFLANFEKLVDEIDQDETIGVEVDKDYTLDLKVAHLAAGIGLTTEELEKKLGFSRGLIGNWHHNRPSLDKILMVANEFGVSLDALLNRTDKVSYSLDLTPLQIRVDTLSKEDQDKVMTFIDVFLDGKEL